MINLSKIVTRKNKLYCYIEVPDSLKRYFNENIFFAEYEFNLKKIPYQFLVIPVISNLIQIAWAAGVNIKLEKVDGRFLESLGDIKKVFKSWYPKLSFKTNLVYEKKIDYQIGGTNSLQLYSGGIDTTASYLKNKADYPKLIVIDLEPAAIHPEILEIAKNRHNKGHIVRSNLYSLINRGNLDRDFGQYIEGSWWGGFQHGMGLLGLAAPISIYEKARKIIIAATHDQSLKIPWGSDPEIDNKVSWADLHCLHDGYEYSRQQKIFNIRDSIIKNNEFPLLMVCNSYAREKNKYNCSRCAKCAQAILGLLVASIDPGKCGFNVTKNTFDWIKESLESMTFFARKSDYWTWEDMHKNLKKYYRDLSSIIEGDLLFLDWFKNIDLTYDDYFNKTAVMTNRPSYKLVKKEDDYFLVD